MFPHTHTLFPALSLLSSEFHFPVRPRVRPSVRPVPILRECVHSLRGRGGGGGGHVAPSVGRSIRGGILRKHPLHCSYCECVVEDSRVSELTTSPARWSGGVDLTMRASERDTPNVLSGCTSLMVASRDIAWMKAMHARQYCVCRLPVEHNTVP